MVDRPQYETVDFSRINEELDAVMSRLEAAETALDNERKKRKSYEVVNDEHRSALGKQSARLSRLEALEERLRDITIENESLKADLERLVDENKKLLNPMIDSSKLSESALQHYISQMIANPSNKVAYLSEHAQKKIYGAIFTELLGSLSTLEVPMAGHMLKIQIAPDLGD